MRKHGIHAKRLARHCHALASEAILRGMMEASYKRVGLVRRKNDGEPPKLYREISFISLYPIPVGAPIAIDGRVIGEVIGQVQRSEQPSYYLMTARVEADRHEVQGLF